MTSDEIINVVKAYNGGKKIECKEKGENIWSDIEHPSWNFENFDYRVKKMPTNLEVANKVIKDTFGIDNYFNDKICAFIYKNKCNSCCSKCQEWWNEEYEEIDDSCPPGIVYF